MLERSQGRRGAGRSCLSPVVKKALGEGRTRFVSVLGVRELLQTSYLTFLGDFGWGEDSLEAEVEGHELGLAEVASEVKEPENGHFSKDFLN